MSLFIDGYRDSFQQDVWLGPCDFTPPRRCTSFFIQCPSAHCPTMLKRQADLASGSLASCWPCLRKESRGRGQKEKTKKEDDEAN